MPLTSIRRITAQRLTQSAAAPHFYLTSVVDAGSLLALRTDLNNAVGDAAPTISITDLLIRACAITLRAHPHVNASRGDDHLLRHGRVNIGCAVALDDGLIVPVIRDADRKSLTEIAAEAHGLVEDSRGDRSDPEQVRRASGYEGPVPVQRWNRDSPRRSRGAGWRSRAERAPPPLGPTCDVERACPVGVLNSWTRRSSRGSNGLPDQRREGDRGEATKLIGRNRTTVSIQTAIQPGTDADNDVPEKQIHRWLDEGGALLPHD